MWQVRGVSFCTFPSFVDNPERVVSAAYDDKYKLRRLMCKCCSVGITKVTYTY